MSTSLPAGAPRAAQHAAPSPAVATRSDAARPATLLQQALLLGISADALLRYSLVGPALALWVVILALAVPALAWSADRTVPRESAGWVAVAFLFACCSAWRASDVLRALDLLAVLAALGMAGIALRDDRLGLRAQRLRDTIWAAAAIIGNVARGIVPLALRQLFHAERDTQVAGRTRAVARAVIIASALLVIFGSLLRSADPIFARLVVLPDVDFGNVASHVVFALAFAWIAGGWAYGAFIADTSGPRPPEQSPFTLGIVDLTTALGTLNALFGVFVLTQLGWFFGGEHFLRETTGLTAAEYARRGFFQMVWVVVLVVPILLATRVALRPERGLARRHTQLSLPIVALLGAIILSAALRMRLYVHFYGLTIDRMLTLVFMGWLAVVLVALALTVLRDRGRPFAATSIVSGLMMLVGLHLFVPDVVVARVNVARTSIASRDRAAPLDLPYLTLLSADAVPIATTATLVAGHTRGAFAGDPEGDTRLCEASTTLLQRWGAESAIERRAKLDVDWRTWNAGEQRARRVVDADAGALQSLRNATCPNAAKKTPSRAAQR